MGVVGLGAPKDGADASETKLFFTKEPFVAPNQPKKIEQIQFSVSSPDEIVRVAELLVHETKLYKMPQRAPHEGSVLDARLGVSNKVDVCATCQQKLGDCSGHFGCIRLHLPVFHVGFLGDTIKLLQAICKTCSRVLLSPVERGGFLKKARNPRAEQLAKKAAFEKVRRIIAGIKDQGLGGVGLMCAQYTVVHLDEFLRID